MKKLEIFSISLVQKTKDQGEVLGNVMFLNFLSNFRKFFEKFMKSKNCEIVKYFQSFWSKKYWTRGRF